MRSLDDATAQQVVRRHAEQVLTLGGWAGFASGDTQPIPCREPDGRDSATVHYAEGSFQLIVPSEQQRALVERVARGWAALGHAVGPVTALPGDGARVSARDDFVELTLGSGQAPAMVLVVVTACYRLPGASP